MVSLLLFFFFFSTSSFALSVNGKTILFRLRAMRLEAAQLLDTITNEEQMDLVETILDREEEEEETNRINQEPLLVTNTDLDDTSRSVLSKLRELKDEEKDLMKKLDSNREFRMISAKLLREEIDHLEQTTPKKAPIKAKFLEENGRK